ncbi:MAG: hypothetical protein AB7Q27_27315, partial [Acidimicrobiia bacterium]
RCDPISGGRQGRDAAAPRVGRRRDATAAVRVVVLSAAGAGFVHRSSLPYIAHCSSTLGRIVGFVAAADFHALS